VLTLALYGLLAIALMGAIFLLAVRFLPAGERIAPSVRDEPLWTLPADRKLGASDIEELRLPVSLRGYRFAETDELLDRLVTELRARDTELERLYALLISADVPIAAPIEPPDDPGEDAAHPAEDAAEPAKDAAEPAEDAAEPAEDAAEPAEHAD
jgi:hypothetical protein